MERLINLDQQLFFFINHDLRNPFFDWLMPMLRNPFFWSPVYVFILVFFVSQYHGKGWLLSLMLLLSFFISDSLSSSIIKPLFMRLRPCHDEIIGQFVRLLVPCGSGFSFVSSHAANHFCISFFLIILFYKQWKWILPLGILWAGMVCFAQVYVGVHFPFDVASGAILGTCIGSITGYITKRNFQL